MPVDLQVRRHTGHVAGPRKLGRGRVRSRPPTDALAGPTGGVGTQIPGTGRSPLWVRVRSGRYGNRSLGWEATEPADPLLEGLSTNPVSTFVRRGRSRSGRSASSSCECFCTAALAGAVPPMPYYVACPSGRNPGLASLSRAKKSPDCDGTPAPSSTHVIRAIATIQTSFARGGPAGSVPERRLAPARKSTGRGCSGRGAVSSSGAHARSTPLAP